MTIRQEIEEKLKKEFLTIQVKNPYNDGHILLRSEEEMEKLSDFIFSTLERQHQADMEEVERVAEEMRKKVEVYFTSDPYRGADKGWNDALDRLINTLKSPSLIEELKR